MDRAAFCSMSVDLSLPWPAPGYIPWCTHIVMPPHASCAHSQYALGYGGGAVCGDRVIISCSVGEDCSAALTTQGSTKVLEGTHFAFASRVDWTRQRFVPRVLHACHATYTTLLSKDSFVSRVRRVGRISSLRVVLARSLLDSFQNRLFCFFDRSP